MASTSSQTFDYGAARKAGFTDEQIAAHLAAKRAAGVNVVVDRAEVQAARAGTDHTMMTAENNPVSQFMASLKGRALGVLPAAGGFVGGLAGAGTPARIPLAAAGGAVGEAGKELLGGEPLSAEKIGGAGAEQGAYELAGGLIGKASKLAVPLMSKALGGVVPLARRYSTTSAGVAKTVLGKPLTEAGERTAARAGEVAIGKRSAILAATKGTVGPNSLAARAIKRAEYKAKRPLSAAERKFIVSMVGKEADEILTEATYGAVSKAAPGTAASPASKIVNQFGKPAIPAKAAQAAPPSRYSAWELEQIKEGAALRAKPAYAASQAAKGIAGDPLLYKDISTSARNKLRGLPGVDALNREIKDNMIAQQAIRGATEKAPGEFLPMRFGPFSAGVQLPRKTIGDIANRLDDPNFQILMRQSPRLAVALLKSAFYTDEPDATAR